MNLHFHNQRWNKIQTTAVYGLVCRCDGDDDATKCTDASVSDATDDAIISAAAAASVVAACRSATSASCCKDSFYSTSA